MPDRPIENPVLRGSFADPQVLVDTGRTSFVALATNGRGHHVQTAFSDDLRSWRRGPDALPELPAWSAAGSTWAPEAIAWPDGRYLMYYTAPGPDPAFQSISVAVADTPGGPYRDDRSVPLLRDDAAGGVIDASPFRASDGTAYVYWKNDGNRIGVPSHLWLSTLSEDGTSVVGDPVRVLSVDRAWEGELVEAPFAWEHEGRVHLFYSANAFSDERYAVGHAVGPGPAGPFVKDADPVLATNDVAAGPGHCVLVEVDGVIWMVYHAWDPDHVGDGAVGRQMWLSRVRFDGTSVRVEPPTATLPPTFP